MIKTPSSFINVPTDFEPSDSSDGYEISRRLLAGMVAAHISGRFNTEPEQTDYEHADAMIDLLKTRLAEVCPRCGGDHAWCQNVQPGEFGTD